MLEKVQNLLQKHFCMYLINECMLNINIVKQNNYVKC